MRKTAIPVLLLFTMPAWGAARLPVVNGGGVSARAAFGEIVESASVPTSASATASVSAPATGKKRLLARSTQKKVPVAVVTPASDVSVGAAIASADAVLSPRRPSPDLWAKNDSALRMPRADEFSVVRADFALPEESLDVAATRPVDAPAARDTKTVAPVDGLDSQIAQLVELQRRADNSVTAPRVAARAAAPVADTPRIAARETVASARDVSARPASVRRMVVPMDDDVIVRTVEKSESPKIAAARDDMTKMSPTELRKAFRKTFLSENKHLSTYQIDDRFDVASDMTVSSGGFTSRRDLSETDDIRVLEIKIKFRDDDAALSRDNYNLLSKYASIVLSNPTRAVQVSIPQRVTKSADARKMAARRLAIVEQVLRDSGVSEHRIMPVLSQRDEDGFVLRMISSDQYETLSQQQRDMFGDTVGKKSYTSMTW